VVERSSSHFGGQREGRRRWGLETRALPQGPTSSN
jgi:hypothetical protein